MGAVNHQPTSIHQVPDLKLTVHVNSLIKPSEPIERRSMILSSIDIAVNFHVKCVFFFSANPRHPLSSVMEKLNLAMLKLLVPYDFVAGRLQVTDSGRLEVDCNAEGVSLVMASSELNLEELEVFRSNPTHFQQLAPMPELADQLKDQPLLAFQVTSFKCGGFSVGASASHLAMDAFGYLIFFMNLISLVSNGTLAVKPVTDRQLLVSTTSPSHLTASVDHQLKIIDSMPRFLTKPNSISADLQFRNFNLSPDNILALKAKASMTGTGSNPKAITTFNVVAAHIWKCKALATCGSDEDKTSTFIYAVNIRRKIQPPIPHSYAGNAILVAHAQATCRDLGTIPFSRVVEMIYEGVLRMSNEYIRAVIDSGLDRGFSMGDVMMTSWMNLEFGELEFEFGKPRWFCLLPVVNSEIIILYSGVDKGSMSAFIGLPGSSSMEKFHSLFYNGFTAQQSRL